ncbi:MAG: SIR2 family protein [Chthoniobacter sp.]|nr:SIR2 family protein [Chthoniobacter sp.]
MSTPKKPRARTSPGILTVPQFCEAIHKAVADGKGIIPLVGAGLSTSAGIPAGGELILYLKLCVAMALGLDGKDAPNGRRWHPRRNAWPEMRRDWVQRATEGERRLNAIVSFRLADKTARRTYLFQQVCRQAYGALTDWRLALQFLARIKLPEKLPPGHEDCSPFGANEQVERLAKVGKYIDEIVAEFPQLTDDLTKIKGVSVFQPELEYQQAHIMGQRWRLEDFSNRVKRIVETTKKIGDLQGSEGPDSNDKLKDFINLGERQKDLADQVTKQVREDEPIILGEVDTHVTDSFFNHLIKGAVPSMGHRMIVHFGRILRTNIVLSLNFDDLLEQAFRNAGVEPAVFEVHQNASLPPTSLLGPQTSLIKLHGGRYGLRADFTLDRDPTHRDRAHFRSYFLGEDWPIETDSSQHRERKASIQPRPAARYDLLVAGFSGKDRHIRKLIQDALDQLNPHQRGGTPTFRVFWCCFSEADETLVKKFFGKEVTSHRVVAVRADNLGLLFWEIYQNATRCLPPGGLEYPSAWRLPAPPQFLPNELEKFNEPGWVKYAEETSAWLKSRRDAGKHPQSNGGNSRKNILLIESPSATAGSSSPGSGFTTFGWRLFQSWHGSNRCIWIDSEDLREAEELKIRLLQAAACHVGRGFQRPSIREPSLNGVFVEELLDVLKVSGKPWVIFLNLRGEHGYYADPFRQLRGPGESAIPLEFQQDLSNEADFRSSRRRLWQWPPEERAKLKELLNMLAGKESSGVDPRSREDLQRLLNIVLLCRENENEATPDEALLERPPVPQISPHVGRSNRPQDVAQKVANDAKKWALRDSPDTAEQVARSRVLLALVLFQPVCHSTALVSRAVLSVPLDETNCERAWVTINRYIVALEKRAIIRRRAGGFLWLHWEVRERLLAMLLIDPEFRDLKPKEFEPLEGRSYLQSRYPQLHLGIGDWMMTFFHATGDQAAAIRAIYHRCWVATLSFIEHEDPNRFVRGRGALCEASNHLEIARASILTSGHSLDVNQCLEGYIERVLCQLLESEQAAKWRDSEEPKSRNLRFLVMVKMKAQLFRIWFHRDLGNCDRVYGALCQYDDVWWHDWTARSSLWSLYETEWPEEAYWNAGFLKLERAVLGITTRAYHYSEGKLWEIANDAGLTKAIIRDSRDFKIWEKLNNWARKPLPKPSENEAPPKSSKKGKLNRTHDVNRFQMRRLLYHSLRRLMELALLRAELEEALAPLRRINKGRDSALNDAQRLYLAAQLLPRYVTEDEYGRLRVEQSRIHSIMAGVLSMRGDYQGVERQLNDALAALDHLTASDDSISATVVALRRIYCKLHQIRATHEPVDETKNVKAPKKSPRKRLLPYYLHDGWKKKTVLSSSDTKQMQKEVMAAEALLDDIGQILVQARSQLARDRKSLWWWMTMCRFQMAWYEIRSGIRHWKKIPADTNERSDDLDRALELLLDVSRRVKFDVYQLARIIDSFLKMVDYSGTIERSQRTDIQAGYRAASEAIDGVRVAIEKVREKDEREAIKRMRERGVRGDELRDGIEKIRERQQVWCMDDGADQYVTRVKARLLEKLNETAETSVKP